MTISFESRFTPCFGHPIRPDQLEFKILSTHPAITGHSDQRVDFPPLHNIHLWPIRFENRFTPRHTRLLGANHIWEHRSTTSDHPIRFEGRLNHHLILPTFRILLIFLHFDYLLTTNGYVIFYVHVKLFFSFRRFELKMYVTKLYSIYCFSMYSYTS